MIVLGYFRTLTTYRSVLVNLGGLTHAGYKSCHLTNSSASKRKQDPLVLPSSLPLNSTRPQTQCLQLMEIYDQH